MTLNMEELEILLALGRQCQKIQITGSAAWGHSEPNDLDLFIAAEPALHGCLIRLGFTLNQHGGSELSYSDPSISAIFTHDLYKIHVQVVSEGWFDLKRQVQEELILLFPGSEWECLSKRTRSKIWSHFLSAAAANAAGHGPLWF